MMKRLCLAIGAFLILACEKKSISSEYPAEVSALASSVGQGLPYLVGKDLRPVWDLNGEPAPRSLDAFKLKDQKGETISKDMLKGKVTIVSFFYSTCPGICPMTTRNLKTVQDQLASNDKFMMLSFSVQPQKDTPKKLQDYARKNHIDYKRWRLATGNRSEIYKLARESLGADTFSEKENQVMKLTPEDFLHSENVYLLDSEQKLRGIYQGRMVSSLEELVRDAKALTE